MATAWSGWVWTVAVAAIAVSGCRTDPRTSGGRPSPSPASSPKPGAARLTAFGTQQEDLAAYLRQVARSQARGRKRADSLTASGYVQSAPAAPAEAAQADADESVTNVQHAGVDEGGIVKV